MARGVQTQAGDGARGFVGDVFVFLGLEGTGEIDERAAAFQKPGAAVLQFATGFGWSPVFFLGADGFSSGSVHSFVRVLWSRAA